MTTTERTFDQVTAGWPTYPVVAEAFATALLWACQVIWQAGPAAVIATTMIPTWYIVGWLIRERDQVATLWVGTIMPRLRLVPPPGSHEDLPDEIAGTGGGRVVRERMATVTVLGERREQHRRVA